MGDAIPYLEQLAEETGELPRPLREAPSLPEWAGFYLESFWLLSAGRTQGLAPSGISTADALAFWRAFPVGDALEFLQLVRAMDAAYLEHHATKAAKT